jgi:hypothetical protein
MVKAGLLAIVEQAMSGNILGAKKAGHHLLAFSNLVPTARAEPTRCFFTYVVMNVRQWPRARGVS